MTRRILIALFGMATFITAALAMTLAPSFSRSSEAEKPGKPRSQQNGKVAADSSDPCVGCSIPAP